MRIACFFIAVLATVPVHATPMRVNVGAAFLQFDAVEPPATVEFYLATPTGDRLTLTHSIRPTALGPQDLIVTEDTAASIGLNWEQWESALRPGSSYDRLNVTVNGQPYNTFCDPFTGMCEPANDFMFNITWPNFFMERIAIIVDYYLPPGHPSAGIQLRAGVDGWAFMVPEPGAWMLLIWGLLWPLQIRVRRN
jgi:hypothetical protein